MIINHQAQIKLMEVRHEQELDNLRMEIQKIMLTNPANNKNPHDKSTESKAEHDPQTRNEMYLLEREDGEVIN